jgi:predicted transcriptional regulator
MRYKPLLTPRMRLILAALGTWHQPLSRARLVELTGAAFSSVLLSISTLRDNGTITETTDGITHYEVSDPTPAAATAVTR